MDGKFYQLYIKGEETRENLAKALRLIATALDGQGEFEQKSIEQIDGSSWVFGSVNTEIHLAK